MSKEEPEIEELWHEFQNANSDIQQKRDNVIKEITKNTVLNEYPAKLSITTALDELIACFSLGGQFKNYYRYGSYDSCKRQREKFWFAIKHGSLMEGKDKPVEELNDKELNSRVKIQEFFKKRLLEDKARGSSEDIWDARKELQSYPFK